MNKPDLIICWPRNCDYPLWRAWMKAYRGLFNVVVIIFTETHNGEDYREFVREAVQPYWVLCVNSPAPTGSEDWRNVAINHGLLQSYNAEWVFFTEQDFFMLDGFYEEVQRLANEGAEAIGVKVGDRIHPCCLFVKRDLMNKTRKDFGIIPDKADHFARFVEDIQGQGVEIKIIDQKYWRHMNGLSHNLSLLGRGERPNYEVDQFQKYLIGCLQIDIPQDWRFKALIKGYLERVGYLG